MKKDAKMPSNEDGGMELDQLLLALKLASFDLGLGQEWYQLGTESVPTYSPIQAAAYLSGRDLRSIQGPLSEEYGEIDPFLWGMLQSASSNIAFSIKLVVDRFKKILSFFGGTRRSKRLTLDRAYTASELCVETWLWFVGMLLPERITNLDRITLFYRPTIKDPESSISNLNILKSVWTSLAIDEETAYSNHGASERCLLISYRCVAHTVSTVSGLHKQRRHFPSLAGHAGQYAFAFFEWTYRAFEIEGMQSEQQETAEKTIKLFEYLLEMK